MPINSPIVVLDSNVVFSALFSSKGYSFELLGHLRDEAFQIAITPPLLFEYEDLLNRPGKIPHLAPKEIDAFLNWLTFVARRHRVYYLWRPRLPDPRDDLVLEAALASSAKFIVTFNAKHFRPAGSLGILALDPHQFISQYLKP
jgi:putative PIN family toxin of toxin-antitoxin system